MKTWRHLTWNKFLFWCNNFHYSTSHLIYSLDTGAIWHLMDYRYIFSSLSIGQINGLLRFNFLTDPANWTREIREIIPDCPRKFFAEVAVQFLFVHSWTRARSSPCHGVFSGVPADETPSRRKEVMSQATLWLVVPGVAKWGCSVPCSRGEPESCR